MQRFVVIASLAATLAVGALSLSGCVPVMVATAVGGTALVATDRRSAGAQVDDEAIELKLATNISNRYGDRVHVNVTSYNGIVLLTGEVPDQALWSEIGAMAKATERVRSVQNELFVGPVTSLSSRSNDTYITSMVKTRLLENNQISAIHIKVVTERGIVYLMGIVSRAEGDVAARIASTTTSVVRVVKVFEYTD